MNKTQQKQEALKRMKLLKLYPNIIKEFEKTASSICLKTEESSTGSTAPKRQSLTILKPKTTHLCIT